MRRLTWRARWFGVYSVGAVWAPLMYFIGWWRETHRAEQFDLWQLSAAEWAWLLVIVANSLVLLAGLIEVARATEP